MYNTVDLLQTDHTIKSGLKRKVAFGKEFLYLKTGRVLKKSWGGGGRERGGGLLS